MIILLVFGLANNKNARKRFGEQKEGESCQPTRIPPVWRPVHTRQNLILDCNFAALRGSLKTN